MFACLYLASFSSAFLTARYVKIHIGSGTWRAGTPVMYPIEVLVAGAISWVDIAAVTVQVSLTHSRLPLDVGRLDRTVNSKLHPRFIDLS